MNRAKKRRQRELANKAANIKKKTTDISPPPPQGPLELAIAHHTAGRLGEAGTLYQQILQDNPNQPVALHLLGVIALQGGNAAAAVELITKAVTIKPDFGEAFSNLAAAHRSMGQQEQAAASLGQAVACNPEDAEAHYNLGNVLLRLGRAEQALASFRNVVAINPAHANAHNNMGTALKALGQLAGAAQSYHKALAIDPGLAQAHNNLGNVFKELGEPDQAVECYEKALRINPGSAEIHNNIGIVLNQSGKLDLALESFRQAVAHNAGFAEAHTNIGNVLNDLGRQDDAVASFQQALSINPPNPEAHNNLGTVFQSLGKLDLAVQSYHKAIDVDAGFAKAHFNLGNAHKEMGRIDEAIANYQQAISIDPQFASACNNLGVALKDSGQRGKAIDSFRHTLSIDPHHVEALNNLGLVLRIMGEIDQSIDTYGKLLAIKPDYMEAHSNLLFVMLHSPGISGEDIVEETLRWGKQHGHHGTPAPFDNNLDPERKLRVGYVSADFRFHAVSYLLEPLMAEHDRQQIELYCYGEVLKPDHVTQRIKNFADHWRSTVGMGDLELVETIRTDKIDVLIDCTGHTANNRLRALSHKPAPVLVNHFIMHGTPSGIDAFDYVLSDPVLSAPGTDHHFTEQVVRLRHGTFAFRPDPQWPEVAPPRAISESPVFACVGDPARIGPKTIALWGRLLDSVAGSSIIFKRGTYNDRLTREYWQERFKGLGRRAVFEDLEGGWGRHMDFYGRVDVVLDTLPTTGNTTCIIPLWMGVPVISMSGGYYCHQNGAAVTSHAGVGELTADNPDDYLHLASELINDRGRLDTLRTTLRDTLRGAPVMDARGRAADMEKAFRDMWRRWCATNAATRTH